MSEEKKTVLITGCTTGSIGDALAREFHARGYRVFAASRRLETMESLAKEGIETIKLDLANDGDIQEAVNEIGKRTGGSLDILVNNAGVGYTASIADSDMDKVRSLFNINVFGHYAVTRVFIPLLIKADHGLVAFNSSIASVVPLPYNGAYSASRAAINALGDTLRVELAPFGVKVVNLLTGSTKYNLDTSPAVEAGLPHSSIYKPVEHTYRDKVSRYQEGAMPTDVYAKAVVGELLKASPSPWFWYGAHSTMAWFLATFMKRAGFNELISKEYGLNKLAEIVRS
ncbi:NAD(P)-binding protein [Schizophyllum commune H4-8]|uniref:NAD(P)-binding protein n=1 Tax=Schizophyllum commune (strain H4-8 / FGSC 9210) TaxID=578458 RepID=UPI00215FAD8D|nr:NAD(P)-binding protein [Schizophyllum commune H4-8]KAI5885420.1 NAD(P)-binding protein [Schizophyllum commune H4-8]